MLGKINKGYLAICGLFFALFLCLFLYPVQSKAQIISPLDIDVSSLPLPTATSSDTVSKPVVIATVNINNIRLVYQRDHEFRIFFVISNGKGYQSGVKYSVGLLKSTGKNSMVVYDEKVFDDVINLGENSQDQREITYNAPQNISGNYDLFVFSKNSNGLPLSLGKVGNVTLKGSSEGVIIKPESCFIKVDGDKKGGKYSLYQGVDINPDENLKLSCEISNPGKETVTAVPSFETYFRTIFGDKVKQENTNNEAITIKGGSQSEVTFNVPKAEKPQFYEAKLVLNDQTANVLSNAITFNYIIRGPNATIQNMILDKDYYSKKDTARISVYWFQSADNIFGGRYEKGSELKGASMELAIASSNGDKCINTLNQSLDGQSINISFEAPVINNCPDPKVTVTIKDANGNIVTTKDFVIISENVPPSSYKSIDLPSWKIIMLNILVFVAIVVFVIILRIAHKKRVEAMMQSNGDNTNKQ